MKEIRKEDISQEVFDLYDDYAHNRIERRQFLEKLSDYAGGGITLGALLSFIQPDYVNRIQVEQDDPRVDESVNTYNSPNGGGSIKALRAKAKGVTTKLGGIVVVHENRGLNPHIEDVCRRAAVAGFLALAPDALTPLGGYPGNDDAGRVLQLKLAWIDMSEDLIAANVTM